MKERDAKRARLGESGKADEVVDDDEVVKVKESTVPIKNEKMIKVESSGNTKYLENHIAKLNKKIILKNQEIKELKRMNKTHENQIYELKKKLEQEKEDREKLAKKFSEVKIHLQRKLDEHKI